MPGGRPNTSGKKVIIKAQRHIRLSDKTNHQHLLPFLLLEHPQLSTISRPAEKSANVDITEEPLTSVPRVKIEDEEDQTTNDNTAPIFWRNKVKATIY